VTAPTDEQAIAHPSLRSGKKALKGGTASRGSWFATSGNAANLRVARRVQHPATIEEEQAVEVARNHEDGTWSALGSVGPKVRDGDIVSPEWTPRSSAAERRSFDNPKRGNPARKRRMA
jgi:hypothetical protein